jgi:hypothetical protein
MAFLVYFIWLIELLIQVGLGALFGNSNARINIGGSSRDSLGGLWFVGLVGILSVVVGAVVGIASADASGGFLGVALGFLIGTMSAGAILELRKGRSRKQDGQAPK